MLSAWCLGILNSHKRFFLSYAAPVVSSGAVIVAIGVFRGEPLNRLIMYVGWATVAGSVLQFVVQLPAVLRLLGRFRPVPSWAGPAVRSVFSRFLPAVAARGVVQLSAWVDTAYASLITERAVSVLTYSQTISLLPVSLFGMSISAAELPDMSADATKSHDERAALLRERLKAGLERMSFFVVPSAVACMALGDLIAGVVLQLGRFSAKDSRFVWYILFGSGVALLAQTSGRLFSSAFYALKNTRTPFLFATARVGLGIALGYYAVRIFPGQVGLPAEMGAVFVTITTSVTAWLEMQLLRRALAREVGGLPSIRGRLARLWASAVFAALVTLGCKLALAAHFGAQQQVLEEWGGAVLPPPDLPARPVSLVLLGVYGVVYFAVTFWGQVPQSRAVFERIFKRLRKS